MNDVQPVLNLFFSTVLTIVITLALAYLRNFLSRFGEKIDAETQAKIQDIVSNSIAQATSYAEQWAKKKQVELGDGKAVSSTDKLLKAAEYALNDLRNHGIAQYSEKEIKDKIESFLGMGTLNINSMNNLANGMQEDGNDSSNDFLHGD